jgi:hypothetical protein
MQKEWRIHSKKFLRSAMSDEVKGTVFRENRIGDHKPAYDEQSTNFIFLVIFNLKSARCVYGE